MNDDLEKPFYNSMEAYQMEQKSDSQLIEETHSTVIELKTVLLGIPGTSNGGLVKQVNDVSKSHGRLKRNFWILVGILIGSGLLGTGLYTLLLGIR